MSLNPAPGLPVWKNKFDLQPLTSMVLVATIVLCATLLVRAGLLLPGISLLFGLGLGFAFQRSRFCLTAAFRDLILFRSTEVARATVLLLCLTSLGFIVIFFYSQYAGASISPHLLPVGLHTAVGAVLFGLGMVIAGGCATGMLMRLGEGYVQQYGTLLGFLAGSLLGAWHRFFWLPVMEASTVIFLPDVLGWPLAVTLQSILFLALYLVLRRLAPRNMSPDARPPKSALSFKSIFRQVWSYNTGAVVIALLATILHFCRDRPFGVTTGITYWSSWLYTRLGGELSGWVYFQKERHQFVLDQSFLLSMESMLNIGFILGALVGALAASEARLRRTRSSKHLLVSVAGGLLMGYGARVSQGCNIGAFVAAIGSFSLQGWIYGVFAFFGAYLGVVLVLRIFLQKE